MGWTAPADLRAQVQKLWDRGELLASLATGERAFPRRLPLKGPSSVELSARFEAARDWIARLRAMRHVRLEMREVRHRVLGANQLPAAAWVDSLDDALALIGKRAEAARFAALVDLTRIRQPALIDWLARRPLRALELERVWAPLLDIVAWTERHPRPAVYLRQVDLPGVHTKLIEAHRGVIGELLERVLPPEAIDPSASGVGQFAQRFGFLDKPARIRFRILDPTMALLPGAAIQDVTLDIATFAQLDPGVGQILITENEVNFLALPRLAGTMALFGSGYGFEQLRNLGWLLDRRLHYWGDIDTHGFAILDQLRGICPHVDSFLMDRETLLAHDELWGEEDRPTTRELHRLTETEAALYDDLRDNRIRPRLRLEQERIGFGWVERALQGLSSRSERPGSDRPGIP